MSMSIFYAQCIGIWLFLLGLAMVIHQARFKKTVMDTFNSPAVMLLSGMVNLAVGLLIVLSHNFWVNAWPVVITIFGWVLIIQGILRLFWPEKFAKIMKDLMSKNTYLILSWIWVIVGLYLIWAGFIVNQ